MRCNAYDLGLRFLRPDRALPFPNLRVRAPPNALLRSADPARSSCRPASLTTPQHGPPSSAGTLAAGPATHAASATTDNQVHWRVTLICHSFRNQDGLFYLGSCDRGEFIGCACRKLRSATFTDESMIHPSRLIHLGWPGNRKKRTKQKTPPTNSHIEVVICALTLPSVSPILISRRKNNEKLIYY